MTSILPQKKRVFNATNSNAIISKSKKKFLNFFPKFRHLDKIWNALKKKQSLESYLFEKL